MSDEKSFSLVERILNAFDKYAIFVAVITLFSVIVFYLVNFNQGLSKDNGDWGTFGDFVGGTLNPIFALFAFLALLKTIRLQSKEMELTREELRRAAAAQEKTEAVLNEQLKITALQKFEGTFFLLLDQHHKMLDVFSEKEIEVEKTSISKLETISDRVFKNTEVETQKATLQRHHELIKYFNFLYQFIDFFDKHLYLFIDSDQENQNKKFDPNDNIYIELIKHSLHSYILQLLAIYSLDNKKHKDFIEKYCLLENIKYKTHKITYQRSELYNITYANDFQIVNLSEKTKTEIENHYDKSAFKKF